MGYHRGSPYCNDGGGRPIGFRYSHTHIPLCQVVAADARYKLQDEAVNALGHLVGDVAAQEPPCSNRAIRTATKGDILVIRLSSRVFERPLDSGRGWLRGRGRIVQCHIHNQEDIPCLGLVKLRARVRFHRIERHRPIAVHYNRRADAASRCV